MRKEWKSFICALLPVILLLTGTPAMAEGTEQLQIHVFNFGKADSYLLMTDDAAVLIDCGESKNGKEIVQYLKEQKIESLDCLIITHFDKDHVGGAAKVLKSVSVKRVLQSNAPKDSKQVDKYLEALELTGIEAETVREELTMAVDGVNFTVYPPEKEYYEKDTSNNSSLVTAIEFGEQAFLFTGDSESERLAELLALEPGEFDVLQIPHHGEWDMLLVSLVKKTNPDYAVITSSEEEPEDLRTLELLRQEGVEAILTREGEADIFSNGTELTVIQNGENINLLKPAA